MGRPALGAAAKKKVASVRLTAAEEAALIARYGTVSRALRTLVVRDVATKDKS